MERSSSFFDLRLLQALALPAIVVTLGMQLMRVLFPSLAWYLRDTVGLPSLQLGYYAFATFLAAFLAAALRRVLGPATALWVSAAGVAVIRVLEQLATDPDLDLWLSMLGTAAFLWFLPLFFGHLRALRGVGAGPVWVFGLLLGLGLDTAIKGAAGTLDLSWTPGAVPLLVVGVLAALVLWLLWLEPAPGREVPADVTGPEALPLMAFGPFLVLQAVVFQNQGWVAQVGGLEPAVAYLVVVAGTLAAVLGAGWGFARPHTQRMILALAGAVYLVLAVYTADQPGTPFLLSVLVGQFIMGWGWGLAGTVAGKPSRQGLRQTTLALGGGAILFVLLAFLYYVSLDLAVPIPRPVYLPLSAALVGLGWVVAAWRVQRQPRTPRWSATPVLAAGALLLVPLIAGLFQASRPPAARPISFPLKVMTYNLHSAFNTDGRQDPEAIAQAIEQAGADIVGLQEISRGWLINGSTDLVAWLSRRLGMPILFQGTSDPVWGNGLIVRSLVLTHGRAPLPKDGTLIERGYLWAEVQVQDAEPVFVIDTHLHHVESEPEPRLRQVEAILAFWDGRARTVLVGDLNATPETQEMDLLRQAGFVDSWQEAGEGPGYTWASDDPIKRIDWIWHTPDLRVLEVHVPQTTASDHLPVVATLEEGR